MNPQEKQIAPLIKAFVFLSIGLWVVITFTQAFDHDELEFIHTAWLSSEGKRIYTDFFQHHHPLAYLVTSVWIGLQGEKVTTLFWMRAENLLVALTCVFLVFRIAKKFWGSVSAWSSIFFLTTSILFTEGILQIRPDPLQILMCLGALFALLQYFESPKRRWLLLCGALSALGFLVLQKAIFFIAAIHLIFLVKVWKEKKINLLISLILFDIILFGISLGTLALSLKHWELSWENYFLLNWKINGIWGKSFLPFKNLLKAFLPNLALCFFAIQGIRRSQPSSPKKELLPQHLFALFALVFFASLFVVRAPFKQYFLPLMIFLSLLAGKGLQDFPMTKVKIIVTLSLTFCLSTVWGIASLQHNKQSIQLQGIRHVIEQTDKEDMVYDGDIRFNIFRKDLDYFWFSTGSGAGLETYRHWKDYSYDLNQLIREKKPKISSDYSLPPTVEVFFKENYTPIDLPSNKEKTYLFPALYHFKH